LPKAKDIVPILSDAERKELTDPRSDYTAEDRIAIAVAFILSSGNSAEAARTATKMLGREVPADNVRQWRRRAWWPVAEDYARTILQKDLEHKYTRIVHETERQILDRVLNGDSRMTKDGAVVKVPATLRDLVGAHSQISDKRAMIRGEPTSRKEDSGTALIGKLIEQLQAHGEKKIEMSIPGEYEHIEEAKLHEETTDRDL